MFRERTRVLVTGGAGFLRSFLCERLLAQGCHVICADNYFTGSRDNIAHLLGNPYFEVIRHDVTIPLYVEVDRIFNLACPASPIHYQFDPVQTTKTSVHGAINMLGLAKRTKARILQASTSEVYGDPAVHPQREEYWGNVNPIGPRACYDEGKRCAETLFFDYHRQHGVAIKVIRIFNTYGPRMHPRDGRVVSNFIIQALQGDPITLYGSGDADAVVLLCRRPDRRHDPLHGYRRRACRALEPGEPRRVHDPRTGRGRDPADRFGVEARPRAASDRRPQAAPPGYHPRAGAANWQPAVQLEEGLTRTIAYFDRLLSTGAGHTDARRAVEQ